MQAEIQKLAEMTGQSEADVARFLVCLSVWTSKGYTFEQAVAKNLQTVERIAERAHLIPKSLVAGMYDDLRAAADRVGNELELYGEQDQFSSDLKTLVATARVCATCEQRGHSSQWCPTNA